MGGDTSGDDGGAGAGVNGGAGAGVNGASGEGCSGEWVGRGGVWWEDNWQTLNTPCMLAHHALGWSVLVEDGGMEG